MPDVRDVSKRLGAETLEKQISLCNKEGEKYFSMDFKFQNELRGAEDFYRDGAHLPMTQSFGIISATLRSLQTNKIPPHTISGVERCFDPSDKILKIKDSESKDRLVFSVGSPKVNK